MKCLAFFLLLVNGTIQAQQSFDAIVENGLIPSIVLEKDTGKTYAVNARMNFYKVQGLNMVVFEKNKVKANKVWGWADATTKENITKNTRFQVASISKTITALGVLKLVELHHLDLDTDVNQYLKTWKIPDNQHTADNKVTIRGLLNHTAGINIDGFGGYPISKPIPTIQEILEGKGATAKIEVLAKPNTAFNYSGGGYLILVKLIEDITGKSFEDFMQQNVLVPLKMKHSSFLQIPQQNRSKGYDQDGIVAEGGWRIMPELAPNGLWTTAQDLALFCTALQKAYDGKQNAILSKKWISQMLQKSAYMDYGLGLGLKIDGENQYFFHAGQNPGGYCGIIICNLKKQNGLVILTNSEDNHLLREIVNGYTKVHNMGYARGLAGPQEVVKTITLNDTHRAEYEGTYQNDSQKELAVTIAKTNDSSLAMHYSHNGYTAILHPIGKDVFYEIFTGLTIKFSRNPTNQQIQGVERRGRNFIRK
jgi:CubicO group peptidase (beta-lactamase class C family)